jgi:hypothetical protein
VCPRKTQSLEELTSIWYEKLKQKGFEDVEQDPDTLKRWASQYYSRRYDEKEFEDKEKYYQLAGQFLYEHKFKSSREQLIWQMHSEGEFIEDIVKAVQKRFRQGKRNRGCSKDTVTKIIKELSEIMLGRK